jgi:anti-anti-sigma regulatory factor
MRRMRSSGEAIDGRGLGRHDHLCWPFDGPADLTPATVEFLADGLAAGLQVELVVAGGTAEARERAAGLGDVDALVDSGALRLSGMSELYGDLPAVDAAQQVARYRAATERALSEGFAGLRVSADITPLVRTAGQRRAFRRYEQLVDRLMAELPFSAMCAFQREITGPLGAAELACAHPVARGGAAPFGMAAGDEGGVLLRGELDLRSHDLFDRVLEDLPVAPGEGRLRIDARGLRFIDHRSLIALDGFARHRGLRVQLAGTAPIVAELAALLDLPAVDVEAVA